MGGENRGLFRCIRRPAFSDVFKLEILSAKFVLIDKT